MVKSPPNFKVGDLVRFAPGHEHVRTSKGYDEIMIVADVEPLVCKVYPTIDGKSSGQYRHWFHHRLMLCEGPW